MGKPYRENTDIRSWYRAVSLDANPARWPGSTRSVTIFGAPTACLPDDSLKRGGGTGAPLYSHLLCGISFNFAGKAIALWDFAANFAGLKSLKYNKKHGLCGNLRKPYRENTNRCSYRRAEYDVNLGSGGDGAPTDQQHCSTRLLPRVTGSGRDRSIGGRIA